MSKTAEQSLNYTFRFLNAAFSDMAQFLEYLEKRAKTSKEYETAKELYEACNKKGEAYMIPVKDIAVDDLKKELENQGIPHFISVSKIDNMNFFAIRTKDLPAVSYAIEKVMERGRNIAEVNFGVMAREANQKQASMLSYHGFNELERKSMIESAKEMGFVISSRKTEDGSYSIYFREEDQKKVKLAFTRLKLKELGVSGERHQKQLNGELQLMKNVMKEATKPLGAGEKRNFYVVSATNIHRSIQITENGFIHKNQTNGNDRTYRSYEGNGRGLERQLYRELATLRQPVILTKEEWEKSCQDDELRKQIVREKQEKYSYKDYQTKLMADKEYHLRSLIEAKMAMDNSDQMENVSSFYNGDVGIQEFYEHELVNQEHIEENTEKQKQIDFESLDSQEKDHLSEYVKEVIYIYLTKSEPEKYFPMREDIELSLDELLNDVKVNQMEHQVTREIEEELFR